MAQESAFQTSFWGDTIAGASPPHPHFENWLVEHRGHYEEVATDKCGATQGNGLQLKYTILQNLALKDFKQRSLIFEKW